LEDANIAMYGIGRMEKDRRRASAAKGSGNFLSDESRFADTGDDNFTARLGENGDGFFKRCTEAGGEIGEGSGFGGEERASGGERGGH
jgi:hypothetical protein